MIHILLYTMKKLLTKPFLVVAFLFFPCIMATNLFYLLPLHFESLGFSKAEIGFVMGASGLGGICAIPLIVFIIDRGRKIMMIRCALVAMAVSTLLFNVKTEYHYFYALPRFLTGGLSILNLISFFTLVSNIVQKEVRSQGFALFGSVGMLSLAISLGIGEPLYRTFGIHFIILFSICLSGIALFASLFIQEEKVEEKQKPARGLSDFVTVFKKKELSVFFLLILLFGGAYGTITSFYPTMLLANGLSRIKGFWIIYPIAGISVRFFLGFLFDRYSRKWVVLAPFLMLPVVLFFIPLIDRYVLVLVPGILYGIAHGTLNPVLTAALIDHSPVRFRGRMNLIFNLCFQLGIWGMSLMGGFIGEYRGVAATFRVASLFMISGLVFLLVSIYRENRTAGSH